MPKGGGGKIKAIDPFYRGPKKRPGEIDAGTVNDPPRTNHRVERKLERVAKMKELRQGLEKRRQERESALDEAKAASEAKLSQLTRGERRKALASGQGVVRVKRASSRVRMEPVVTSAMGNALSEFQSLFASKSANADPVAKEMNQLVRQQTRQLASEVDFAKQVAISNALSKQRRDKSELRRLADADADPHDMLRRGAPKTNFVDADELARTLMQQVAFERAQGERYFDYQARLEKEAARVRTKRVVDDQGHKRVSHARKFAERQKQRAAERAERQKQRALDVDDDRTYYDAPQFGDVAEAPPQLPKLPQRLLKRKAPPAASPFAMPTPKQAAAAERAGVPLIESVAGGREATRAAITGSARSTSLVGAASLSVEAYAQQVREQYRLVKRKRLEQRR